MLTLIHSPQTRSSRVLWLIDEMGIDAKVAINTVSVRRADGSGAPDPANPHPEGKVPVLLDGGVMISETSAVMVYLTTQFPETGLAPQPGTPKWGEYLTWMHWYGSVMEPVLVLHAAGVGHPFLTATIREVPEVIARIRSALQRGPWLLGDQFSAADLLCFSPYNWFKDATPDDPLIKDWVARCQARPSVARVSAKDQVWRATAA